MERQRDVPPKDDESLWVERSELWLKHGASTRAPRGRRQRRSDHLILCGHGVSLRIQDGALVIRDGFTHYPQLDQTYRFFRGDLALPPRIVMLDGSGTVSFDVLTWLASQGVALVCLNWKGEAVSVLSAVGAVTDPAKLNWQKETRADNARRMAFSTDLIIRKLARSIETLGAHVPDCRRREIAIGTASDGVARLRAGPPSDMETLRGIEAKAATVYFASWRQVQIRWKATARRPIPDDWRVFTGRASLAHGRKFKNINATHPVNAMLNYGYGVLQARLHIEAVGAGYDPTIGIMHHGYRGTLAYLFDLMEPERPKVDAAVLRFVGENTFSAADFVITDGGVCRLSPQLARVVCEVAST